MRVPGLFLEASQLTYGISIMITCRIAPQGKLVKLTPAGRSSLPKARPSSAFCMWQWWGGRRPATGLQSQNQGQAEGLNQRRNGGCPRTKTGVWVGRWDSRGRETWGRMVVVRTEERIWTKRCSAADWVGPGDLLRSGRQSWLHDSEIKMLPQKHKQTV